MSVAEMRGHGIKIFYMIAAVAGLVLFYTATSRLPVKIIAAEAGNQGFRTMVGVGEVIRNRGGFDGFSVLQKDIESIWRSELPSVRRKAEFAWALSAVTRFARGATHFENVRAFGPPPWAPEMRETVVMDDFVFFKEKAE